MDIHQQADLVAAATKALTRPGSFLNYGNPELFKTWGSVISQNRDSEALARSNFRSMVKHAEGLSDNRFALDAVLELPGSNGIHRYTPREDIEDISEVMEVARSNHFLVGWIEELNVRVLVDPKAPIEPANITRIFSELVAIMGEAEERGVIDEDDLAELEGEELYQAFEDYVGQIHRGASDYANMPEAIINDAGVLYQYARENDIVRSIEDLDSYTVEEAIFGLVQEWAYADYEHTYRHQLPLF